MSLPFSSTGRPRIVTSIGTLRLLYGVLAIGFGMVLAYSPSAYLNFMGESESDYVSVEELAFVASFAGILIGIQGITGVVIAVATLLGKKWAWIANVVFASLLIILLASDVAFGYYDSAFGIFFNGFILAYMFSKPVKAYFG
ncbi:MAG: hypothetical protein ACRD99_05160, partial [Nitrososphaera sp.]